MDIVHTDQSGQIRPQTGKNGHISGRIKTGLTAVFIFLGAHLKVCRQALCLITLRFVILRKSGNIFRNQIAVCFCLIADLIYSIEGLLVDLAGIQLFLQPVSVGNIVNITIPLPLLEHIHFLAVALHLGKGRIALEDQSLIQAGVDHNHNHDHNDDNGNDTAQDSVEQVFCHKFITSLDWIHPAATVCLSGAAITHRRE